MLREHIIETALNLFARNGIKRISMNDIAQAAGVSKRTLYEFFNDKETLLIQAMDATFSRAETWVGELSEKTCTALEVFLLINDRLLVNNSAGYCETLYTDIKRYPSACEHLMRYKKRMLDNTIHLLKQGVVDGVFHPEIDYEIIALLAREHIDMLGELPRMLGKFIPEKMHQMIFLIFIRGICTEAGRKILEQHEMKKRYKMQQ
ncbi:MAG: TetR/AcrR family transcriptional regulator [Tannerella sp.]|jgi:AcrR family transcriptional regulator|nr:TetR/AcrR family transcriptional regulator [Tannerella sp.]